MSGVWALPTSILLIVAVMVIVFVMVVATILPDTLRESKSRMAGGKDLALELEAKGYAQFADEAA